MAISYNSEHLRKALEYVDNWKEHGAIPQIARLALHIGISKQTLYVWEKMPECSDLADVCARVRLMQEGSLIDGGLTRTYDSSLSKLMLMKHGYTDKQEIDHTTKGEKVAPSFGFVEVGDIKEEE